MDRIVTRGWRRLIEPLASVKTVQDRRQARCLAGLLLGLLPLGLLGMALPGRFQSALALLDTICLALAYILSRRGRYRPAAALTVGVISLTLFALALPVVEPGGFNFLFYLAAPLLLADRFLPRPAWLVLVALHLAGLLLLPLFTSTVTLAGTGSVLGPAAFLLIVSVLILAAGRHQAVVERDRQAEQAQFRQVLAAISDHVYVTEVSADGRRRNRYISRHAESLTGYPRQRFLADWRFWPSSVIRPEDRAAAAEQAARLAAGQASELEYRLVRADGGIVWVRDRARVERQGDRRVVYGLVSDITPLKQAEEERRRLSIALEQIGEGVIITDAGGTIVYVNPAFERLSGYGQGEVLGHNPRLLKSGQQDATFYREMWATLTAGQTWHGRFSNQRKDGALYTVEATISPLRNEEGQVVNYVAIERDVTRELALEAQYRQAQKMEAVGRLAGGVAHDFNNLLTAILGYADFVLAELPTDGQPHRDVAQIKQNAQRAATLTQQLLAFSRRQVLQPEVLDLNRVVQDIGKLLRRLLGEDIELAILPGQELWPVRVDRGQVGQALMNLTVNARDAMPQGGRLTIETMNVRLDAAYAGHHAGVRPGPYVLLAVSDTGQGIEAETLAHIFEPFFTTKEQGEGTGLGLAMVHGLVRQSGGHIWVYSEPGQGTTFKIYLPHAAGTEAPEEAERRAAPVRLERGEATVLLVEDEDAVRQLAARALRERGYTVLEARDGEEALGLSGEYPGPIDLLLTGVVLPGRLSGPQVAKRLSAGRPALKVLYMSGYTDTAIARQGTLRLEPGLAYLQKPFRPVDLLRRVQAVLAG